MERLAQLIGKLNEQFEQNADPSQLLATTQQIELELVQLSAAVRKVPGTSKVAVVMPSSRPVMVAAAPAPVVHQPEPEPVRNVAVEEPAVEEQETITYTETPVSDPVDEEIPVVATVRVEEEIPVAEEIIPVLNGHSNGYHYDPLKEIPTLAQQPVTKEINESIGYGTQSSLNDKLKEEVVEVGHRLNDSPVRDLKRAIGVNDRFVFISELFRGDEVMYERSIKTINGFRILPEAEYWIERELKVKLGWDETKPITRHFYQLVKRRFS
ncbi:hypothetical protein HHL16_18280 [Pseudoflavitalea sp. G-6-1-2]|uniref:hypothetical protein n=1 Tax=Pseudoflavitalea sp. G-6-1-2 TaxID=2728841 RepID=UPI00146C3A6A|nr:hypothetical protein [Pseudoflavitalea sp. G-6-1-2]NML22839.1 hypothetical protein [Pseudoflavitalea sp. G-6-1-2]